MEEILGSETLDISLKLDELAIQILKVMQGIVLERQYLDDSLKDGFLKLAKSRYLMTGQKINTFQINTSNLHSTQKVLTNLEEVNGVKFTAFHISNISNVEKCIKEQSDTFGDGLRYAKNVNPEKSKSNNDVYNTEEKKTFPENPLNWFGVLVPSSLKDCQGRFEQVIKTSTKIVSLQNELRALSEEYKKLRSRKAIRVVQPDY